MDAAHIYETVLGERLDPYSGIANAFAEGSRCAKLYEEIFLAKQRLCDRLATQEDPDVERLIDTEIMHNLQLSNMTGVDRLSCTTQFVFNNEQPSLRSFCSAEPVAK